MKVQGQREKVTCCEGIMPFNHKYVTIHDKATLQLWLSYGSWVGEIILNYPGGPNVITGVLVKERGQDQSLKRRCDYECKHEWWWEREIWSCYDAGSVQEERGHKSRNEGVPKSWKRQAKICLLETSEGKQFLPTLILGLLNSKALRQQMCAFFLWNKMCYSNDRRLIHLPEVEWRVKPTLTSCLNY